MKLVQVMSPEQKWITVFQTAAAKPGIYTRHRILNIFPKVYE